MRSAKRDTHRLAILLSLAALLVACGGGSAREERPSILRWGGDLFGSGSTVSVVDSISGDVILAGGELGFHGVAGGDYLGAGGTQVIGGRVSGDVRAAGGEIRLGGQVARNLTAAGGMIEIAEDARVGGNVYLAGQRIRVDGRIDGFLRAAGQEVVLDGPVEGSANVRGGSLRVGPGARIAGDLSYTVPAGKVLIDPGAQIDGSVTAHRVRPGPPIGIFRALLMIGFLLAGMALVALFPMAAGAAEAALRRRPAAALGFGVLWALLIPICLVLLAITVIGLPLALILLAIYLISIYIGRAVIALWIGRRLLRGRPRPARGRLVMAFLLGGVILLLLSLIPILGGIVAVVATVLGLGALLLAYRQRREYAPES